MKKLSGFFNWNNGWREIVEKRSGPNLRPGDTVKFDPIFRHCSWYTDQSMKVQNVIPKKWELMPCDFYVDIAGLPVLTMNTMFIK